MITVRECIAQIERNHNMNRGDIMKTLHEKRFAQYRQEVMLLASLCGRTYGQIARVMEVQSNTVSRGIRRANLRRRHKVLYRDTPMPTKSIQEWIRFTAQKHGLQAHELKVYESRRQKVAYARRELCYICRQDGWPTTMIGAAINIDPSSVHKASGLFQPQ